MGVCVCVCGWVCVWVVGEVKDACQGVLCMPLLMRLAMHYEPESDITSVRICTTRCSSTLVGFLTSTWIISVPGNFVRGQLV